MAKRNRNKEVESSPEIELGSNLNLLEQVRATILRIQEGSSDYSKQLRDVNRELKNSESAYAKIEARLNSYNKETVNIKEVENELFKARQQTALLQQNQKTIQQKSIELKQGEKILDEQGLKLAEQRLAMLVTEKGNIKKGRAAEFDRLTTLIQATKNMALAVQASEEQLALSQENEKIVAETAAKEKALGKQMGVRAGIMQSIGKTLGVEQEVRKALISASREAMVYDEKTGKITSGNINKIKVGFDAITKGVRSNLSVMSVGTKVFAGLGILIKGARFAADMLGKAFSKVGGVIRGLSPDTSSFFANITGPIQSLVSNIPIVGGLLSGVVGAASSLLDLIIGVDHKIVSMGRQLGMGASQARKLNDEFIKLAANAADNAITSNRLWKSYSDIASVNGINNKVSEEILKTNIKLADYAGLEAETRTQLANVAMITGKTMESTTTEILVQVSAMSKATGIQFNQQKILKEVTSLSGRLGLEFTKYPAKIAQTLLQTKALGIELNSLNSMADGFLDFESSISKEFEAQVLSGKEINLMKARELFLNNDLAGAAAEIAKQVGSSEEFLKMDRIAATAFASSMEMSVDQMADMLKKQELFAKFEVGSQKELIKKIALMKQQGEEQKAINLLKDKEAYNNFINLSMQEDLMTSFDKLKNSLVDFLTKNNILEKLQGYIKQLTDPENLEGVINKVKGWIGTFMGFLTDTMSAILKGIGYIGDLFTSGIEGDLFEEQMYKRAAEVENLGAIIQENLSGEFKSKNNTGTPQKEVNAKDAVIFPSSNTVVNKDPLDYTIFTKNPKALSQPAPQIDMNQMVAAFTTALNQRPLNISLNANLAMDGQPTAKVVVNSIKNTVITGFDRQSGQMSLNV